ncbi:doublecortin domain-containing protein 2-like isoform X2 [Petromyzon marinus]|uniref:doublecortin domain-containing protein 2-like isoform X2 n=1 Tax=Petromyzon marinus TaxID=7757 RepID=UPI003F6EBB54
MSSSAGKTPFVATQSPPAKNILVYRNGDAFFPGRRLVVNPRHVVNFDVFLGTVTDGLRSTFAVRNIYTPAGGSRVPDLHSLLQHGGREFVAAGSERFKKLHYAEIGTIKPKTNNKCFSEIKPVLHSRVVVSARWRKCAPEPCFIFLFTNGDLVVPPARLLIPRRVMADWERVLALATERLNLRTGAVRRLCQLEGLPVRGASELENGHFYVAVGSERFKPLPYGELVARWASRSRVRRSNRTSLPPVSSNWKKKSEFWSLHGQKCNSLSFSRMEENRHTRSTGDVREGASDGPTRPKAAGKKDEEGKGDRTDSDAVFHPRPVRVKRGNGGRRSSHSPSSGDEAGVFKARPGRREMQGAREVKEDTNTKVELPLDQRAAETVEEDLTEPTARKNKVAHSKESPPFSLRPARVNHSPHLAALVNGNGPRKQENADSSGSLQLPREPIGPH